MAIFNMVWGWQQSPTELDYLCFTAQVEDCSVTLSALWTPTAVNLEISTDWQTWNNYTIWTAISLPLAGDKVYMRNTSTVDTWFSTSVSNAYRFYINGVVAWSGDVMYLLNKNKASVVPEFGFTWLFQSASGLLFPPNISATTIRDQWCRLMFKSSWIIKAPDLPATTVWDYWYCQMFDSCSSLYSTSNISATSLWNYACEYMYNTCQGLKKAKPLPTQTVGTNCYQKMFYMSRYLEEAPWYIGATSLSSSCCSQMFYQCNQLKTAPRIDATAVEASSCSRMFYQCEKLEQLPRLKALTLADSCYEEMFRWCTKIKMSTTQVDDYQTEYRIPIAGTWTSWNNSLYLMFMSTGGSYKGNPSVNTTYYTSNVLV